MDRTPAFNAVLPETFAPTRAAPDRPVKGRSVRTPALALACVLMIGSFASPAMASTETNTRLVRCGDQSCLLIRGHREDPASIVSINGQAVSVEGGHGWRVRVPVDTVRQWSAPAAREIEVSLRDPETQRETTDSVDLPVGLLGNLTDLASLEISVR
jgi:hypothetical protein